MRQHASRLLLLLGLLLANEPAQATTWQVTGNATMATANAGVVAGDLVMVAAGTYTTMPNPGALGPGTPSGGFITYRASGAVIYSGSLTMSDAYTRIVGGTLTGTLQLGTVRRAWADSMTLADIRGAGMDSCKVSNGSWVGQCYWDGDCISGYPACPGGRDWCDADTLQNMTSTSTFTGLTQAAYFTRFCRNWVWNNIVVNATFTADGSDDFPLIGHYTSVNGKCVSNRWNLINNIGYDGTSAKNAYIALDNRDSTQGNHFERDSIFSTGTATARTGWVLLSNSGSLPGTTLRNSYTRCYWSASKGMTAYWQNGANSDTLQFCVSVSQNDEALDDGGNVGNDVLIRHNTFAGWQQVVKNSDSSVGSGGGFLNNIVYGFSTPGDSCNTNTDAPTARFSGWAADSNLFFHVGLQPDSARSIQNSGGTCQGPIAYNAHSRYKDPIFTNALFATFDPRLQAGSLALNANLAPSVWADGYVGVIGTVAAGTTIHQHSFLRFFLHGHH